MSSGLRGGCARRIGVVLLACGAALGRAQGADADAALMTQGKALFSGGANPPCALCHTLKDAAAAGAIGPVLDELQPDAERVLAALKNGIGAMPSYRSSLSDEQMRALARYVAKASGGAK
jgi:sulfite dehydrogenase